MIVWFSFEWGPDATYFVPVIEAGEGSGAIIADGVADALGDPDFLRWFVDRFAGLRVPSRVSRQRFSAPDASLPSDGSR